MPAACRTPSKTSARRSVLTSIGSLLSHDATKHVLCKDFKRATRFCPSRTIRALRDVRTNCEAPPFIMSELATRPRPPRPPVTTWRPWVNSSDSFVEIPIRTRSLATKRWLCAVSGSAAPVAASGNSAKLGSHRKSVLCVHIAGSSRRNTRAKPHAPPCAEVKTGMPIEDVPCVKMVMEGILAKSTTRCVRLSKVCMAHNEGAADTFVVRHSKAACHGRNVIGCDVHEASRYSE